MLFQIIFISLLPFISFASEESVFEAIDRDVKAIESREPTYAEEKACYPDIGCFTTDGPMKHTDILPASPEKINTKFFAYTQSSPNTEHEISAKDANSWTVVAQNKPLVIISHGFNNNGKTPELLAIKDSLIKDANIATVVMVDWAKGAASPWYTEAATNTQVVGRQIAFLTETLRAKHNIDPKSVHLIGFSLGAQVSGFAGKFSQSEYKWKFGRISALDSAAPLFEGYPGSFLNQEDAIFVDAIHTSAGNNLLSGEVGFIAPIGHVDFFPHDGKKQPRCSGSFQISCNHYSSVIYFEASLSGKCQFTAYKCPNWTDFAADKCKANGDSRLGYHSIDAAGRGVRYLSVNKDYPFCMN